MANYFTIPSSKKYYTVIPSQREWQCLYIYYSIYKQINSLYIYYYKNIDNIKNLNDFVLKDLDFFNLLIIYKKCIIDY